MPERCPPSDEQIRDDVRQRLAADPHLDASTVEVGVRDGAVVLTGSIKSRTVMRYVEDLVRKTPGVRDVQGDLRIDPRASVLMGGGRTTGRGGTSGGGPAVL
jgi:osmotically-inducible protein OsmY